MKRADETRGGQAKRRVKNLAAAFRTGPDRGLWRGAPRPGNAANRQSAGRCVTCVCRHVQSLPQTNAPQTAGYRDDFLYSPSNSHAGRGPSAVGGRGNSIDSINDLRVLAMP